MANMKKSPFSRRRIGTTFCAIVALIACAIALCAFVYPSSVCEANSAMRYYEGMNASGAILTTKNSPVVVEREDLTFNIQFDKQTSNGTQIGSVSAKYTFKNPSELTAKTNVVFPIAFLDDVMSNSAAFSEYGVKIDDEKASYKLRFSYLESRDKFSLDAVKNIKDAMIDDEFYKPDTVVYKYTYSCTAQNAYCMLYMGNLEPRKVLCGSEVNGYWQNFDGTANLAFWATGQDFVFYAIGEEIDFAERASFYLDYDREQEAVGSLRLADKSETSFENLAYSYFEEGYGASKTDWYNAVVTSLTKSRTRFSTKQMLNVRKNLFCWFEYDMTFAPGQTILNEVIAPLYPSVNYAYSPSKYMFTYLVSPASTWAGFKDLNVRINTNYFLLQASDDFEKIEGGYRWHSDALPEHELTFTLCASENPTSRNYTASRKLVQVILLSVFEPLLVALVGLVVVVSVIKRREKKYGVSKKEKKKADNQENNQAEKQEERDE